MALELYPFNVNAIRRTTDAVTESTYFDPRAVLGAVLKTTLEEAETAIAEGMFPGNEYQRQYTATYKEQRALPADVVDELQRYPDPKRREALLTIWGGCPDDVVDLAPGIHEAFKLPEMGRRRGSRRKQGQRVKRLSYRRRVAMTRVSLPGWE